MKNTSEGSYGIESSEKVNSNKESHENKEESLLEQETEKPDAFAELSSGNQELAESEKAIRNMEEILNKDSKKIDEIRQKMELPESSDPDSISAGEINADSLEKMKKGFAEKSNEMKKMEKQFLEIPENGFIEESEGRMYSERDEMAEEFLEKFEKRMEELEEKEEEEMKEFREDMLKEWIDNSVKWAFDKCHTILDDSENSEKAKKILAIKIKSGLSSREAEFVESGNLELLEFSLSIDTAKYEVSQKGKRTFITGIEFGKIGFDDAKEKDILKNKEKKEIEIAKSRGILEEEKGL